MTRYKTIFIAMMIFLIVGCAAGTSRSKTDTGLQPKGKINCAKIEPLTEEERYFCMSGGQ
jgi:hypothetical protein